MKHMQKVFQLDSVKKYLICEDYYNNQVILIALVKINWKNGPNNYLTQLKRLNLNMSFFV